MISADVGPIPRIGTTPLRSLSPILHLPRDTRIHALRSRTQHGIHLIGNIATHWNLSMWQKVIGILHGREQVGSSWKLCCPRHAGPVIQVKQPDEFTLYSPKGGCREASSALIAFRAASSMPGEVSFQTYAQNLQMPIALPASIPGL